MKKFKYVVKDPSKIFNLIHGCNLLILQKYSRVGESIVEDIRCDEFIRMLPTYGSIEFFIYNEDHGGPYEIRKCILTKGEQRYEVNGLGLISLKVNVDIEKIECDFVVNIEANRRDMCNPIACSWNWESINISMTRLELVALQGNA
jgi:hypothetical protein